MEHDASGIIVLLELAQDKFRMRTAPFINGLKIIPAKEQMTGAKNLGDNAVLQQARILHLVDIDIDKPPRPFSCHAVLPEKRIHLHQQIRKIQSMQLVKALII